MLLRRSGEAGGHEIDARAALDPRVDSGVPEGKALLAFADAVLADDLEERERTRADVRARIGERAFVDACGVIAHFSMMVRIADGTGIPLDGRLDVLTSAL